jgi:hypothetical protein
LRITDFEEEWQERQNSFSCLLLLSFHSATEGISNHKLKSTNGEFLSVGYAEAQRGLRLKECDQFARAAFANLLRVKRQDVKEKLKCKSEGE